MIGPHGSLTHCRWKKDFVKSRILLDKSWQKIACSTTFMSQLLTTRLHGALAVEEDTIIQEAVKAASAASAEAGTEALNAAIGGLNLTGSED